MAISITRSVSGSRPVDSQSKQINVSFRISGIVGAIVSIVLEKRQRETGNALLRHGKKRETGSMGGGGAQSSPAIQWRKCPRCSSTLQSRGRGNRRALLGGRGQSGRGGGPLHRHSGRQRWGFEWGRLSRARQRVLG